MYFQIGPTVPDDDFSWIICKSPKGGGYERPVGGPKTGRKVVGSFNADGSYQIMVHNDGVLFFNEMRARNEAAYVRPEPWIVCPSNLKGLSVAFRSALHGDAGKDIPKERFFAPKNLQATVGPYPRTGEEKIWTAAFEALGLKVEVLDEETTQAFTLDIKTAEPMSVTTFLQKIYISMMAFTAQWAFFDKIDDAKIESYLRLTTGWLTEVAEPYRTAIINKLTAYHKNLQARFESPEDSALARQVGEGEIVKKADREDEIVKKISLHERRHELILSNMSENTLQIVDLGSGEGKLFSKLRERFPVATLIGVDASRERVNRTHRKLKKAKAALANAPTQIYHDNLLFPKNWEELQGADVLIASEVIEHMNLGDRRHFIKLVAELLEPRTLFITTPNIEANVPVLGMPEGELRHTDHKIEYTKAQFETEVVQPLSAHYDVTYLEVMPGEPIQPSFCIKAARKTWKTEDGNVVPLGSSNTSGFLANRIKRMSEPSYFATTNVTVSPKDMRDGFTSYPFLENSRGIFYLGPTIAPVDYIPELEQYLVGASEGGPYLEHPLAAFKYFLDRDVRVLVEEPKYMGSRGYLLLFKNPEQAHAMGFEQPIVMNARSGGPFFNDARAMDIWKDVAPKLEDDFIILDAEVMPWALKAEKLIARDFVLPGEAALLWRWRMQGTSPDDNELLSNTQQYLSAVHRYAGKTPLEVRAFHVLASGGIKQGKWKMQFENARLGFFQTHLQQIAKIKKLEGDLVKSVDYKIVNLGNEVDKAESVRRWMAYCESGGEGFVYKPLTFLTMSETGFPIQAALKVRGKDYLRIIYGMDYLRPEYFDRLKQRGTKMKRLLAAQEQDIAMTILRTFINGNETERLRAIGAFMGLEFAQTATIDKTL